MFNNNSFQEKVFASCNHYIATIHEIRNSFIKDAKIDSNKVSVIPHGINTNLYPYISYEKRCAAKLEAGLNTDVPNLLFCARVAQNKGILVALEVWKKYINDIPTVDFIL